ncbi:MULTISPECIES: LysE family translocator [Brevibacterium]|uniref:LysE family translocator n=1 Tax=Brevibacterium TaxID=1696 RepID=UPI001BAAF197|nr:LysE family translocator [Brevibacterium sp. W7.2]
MTGPELITIAGAATVLAVTPGPETILTVRLSALRRKAGLIYSLGSATGMTIWMIAALTGISALLTAYPSALLVLKIVGGAYLCFLGVLAARQALKIRSELRGTAPLGPVGEIAAATDDIVADDLVAEVAPAKGAHPWGQLASIISYRRGLLSSLSNPKAGLFFLAVMPTLVPASPAGTDYVLLVAIVVGLLLAYQILLALIAGYAAAALQRRSTDFWIEAVSAGILAVMGITVAAIPM